MKAPEKLGHNTKYKGERLTQKTLSFTAAQLEWIKTNGAQKLRALIDIEIKKAIKNEQNNL